MKALVIYATKAEAEDTLKRFEGKQKAAHLYACDSFDLLICGIGPLSAAVHSAPLIPHYEHVYNLGIAGSIGQRCGLGEIYPIRQFLRWVCTPEGLDQHSKDMLDAHNPPVTLERDGLTLATSDYPIHSPEAGLSARGADLVDMEAYSIARAANISQKPFSCYKLVSDFTRSDGPELIGTYIKRWSCMLADHAEELL